jgi:hypothetical protein
VAQHIVETDDRIGELPQLVHLLIEERNGHRQRVALDVVDLVVHQHPQAAVAVAACADRNRRLADPAVDGVLQNLLDTRRIHGGLA